MTTHGFTAELRPVRPPIPFRETRLWNKPAETGLKRGFFLPPGSSRPGFSGVPLSNQPY